MHFAPRLAALVLGAMPSRFRRTALRVAVFVHRPSSIASEHRRRTGRSVRDRARDRGPAPRRGAAERRHGPRREGAALPCVGPARPVVGLDRRRLAQQQARDGGLFARRARAGKPDGQGGRVHGRRDPEGNPHYWLPTRATARSWRARSPGVRDRRSTERSRSATRARTRSRTRPTRAARGRATVAAMKSKTILTYHRSWPYLADAFGLEIVETIEPVPGIRPRRGISPTCRSSCPRGT